MSVTLITAVHILVLVLFENNFDFKELLKANAALSAFVTFDQSFLILSTAPKYRNPPTILEVVDPVSGLSPFSSRTIISVFRH